MDKGNSLIVVAAALIDSDGRLLVQQRPQGKPMAGLWEFPGGKVESDELPERAKNFSTFAYDAFVINRKRNPITTGKNIHKLR